MNLEGFIEVKNHETVKIGGLEKNSEAIKVGQAQVQRGDLPERGREGTDELTLREGEKRTVRSTPPTWEPPLVDEDWHAICQAIHKGVEGADWENLSYKFVEMEKEVNVCHPSGRSRAVTLWKIRDAKEGCDVATKNQGSEEVRQELRSAHRQLLDSRREQKLSGYFC